MLGEDFSSISRNDVDSHAINHCSLVFFSFWIAPFLIRWDRALLDSWIIRGP